MPPTLRKESKEDTAMPQESREQNHNSMKNFSINVCTLPRANISGYQHLPEGGRHDDLLVSLDVSQQYLAISPSKNQRTDCLLLP